MSGELPDRDTIAEAVLDARNEWVLERGSMPDTVFLPPHYALSVLYAMVGEMSEGDDRDRIAAAGVDAIYGGTLWGMKARPGLALHVGRMGADPAETLPNGSASEG